MKRFSWESAALGALFCLVMLFFAELGAELMGRTEARSVTAITCPAVAVEALPVFEVCCQETCAKFDTSQEAEQWRFLNC